MTYVEFVVTALVFWLLGLCSAAVMLSKMIEIYQDERYKQMEKSDMERLMLGDWLDRP